jgi:hypothetical protein
MVVASLLGIAGRSASVPVIVIMLVAFVTAGPSGGNVMVFVGSLGILLLGTGPLSLWRPEDALVERALHRGTG